MQIRAVELHHIQIPFRSSFQHALKSRRATEAVIVAVHSDEGGTGYGEILPREYLTGETIETVLRNEAPARARTWLSPQFNATFNTKQEVVEWLLLRLASAGRALATFGGFELALLDLAGKHFGFPVGEVLELSPGPELPAGVVIGFEVPTGSLSKYCATLRLMGKRHVKVKVGHADDLQRLETVFDVLGKSACIRIDANASWSADEAVDTLLEMRRFNIHSVEQPVRVNDLSGMRYVRERTQMRVMADESLCTFEDGQQLIDSQAADLFNVRIGKCGGLLASLRLVRLAHAHGLQCHLGTLVGETAILSCVAELFGRSVSGFECLEGKGQNKFLLEEDIVEANGQAKGTEERGLGVNVSTSRLARFRVSEPVVFRAGHC